MTDQILTYDEANKYFRYDPDTGIIIRKITTNSRAKAGDIVNALNNLGYIQVSLNYKRYLGHRLAWLLYYGEWPKQIDHINRVRNDNRIENLRDVDQQTNLRNTKLYRGNTSGIGGVSWYTASNKWQAVIKINQKQKHLGYYKDKFEAICARKSAENKYGFHPTHGR